MELRVKAGGPAVCTNGGLSCTCPGEGVSRDDACEHIRIGHKDAAAPGDDLGCATHALEGGDIAVGRSLDLHPGRPHEAAPGETPGAAGAGGKGEGGAAVHDFGEHFVRGQCRCTAYVWSNRWRDDLKDDFVMLRTEAIWLLQTVNAFNDLFNSDPDTEQVLKKTAGLL